LKNKFAIFFLVLALLAAVFTLLGDGSYGKLLALRDSLRTQKEINAELEERVRALDARTRGIREDDRALEKEARNQLGLARPNELIFFFEKKESAQNGSTQKTK